jgi:hypothetical protein
MEFSKKTIPQDFIEIKSKYNLIQTTPELLANASHYGYNSKRMKEGEQLITKAEQMCFDQQAKYQESYAGTWEFNEEFKEMKKIYSKHVKIARIFLCSNKQKQKELGISSKKKESFDAFANQYCHFYREVQEDPELLKSFEHYNISPLDLRQSLSLLTKVEQLKDKQLNLIVLAREATSNRDFAINAAQEWYRKFAAFASLPINENTNQRD